MTDAERLSAIRQALFPDPEPMPGQPKHFVSHNVTDNLDGVLIDLERTGADAGCLRTLRTIAVQIEVASRFVVSPGKPPRIVLQQ